jgi:CBS domain-containing protein
MITLDSHTTSFPPFGRTNMGCVRDILDLKGSHIETISPMATAYDAADHMNRYKIGSLVVLAGERLVGIITERDILVRIVAQCRDPGSTLVENVMTTEVACCRLHTSLDEARSTLKNRRIRHLPVLDDDDRLCGVISIGDLNAWNSNDQERTIHLLNEYIHGVA